MTLLLRQQPVASDLRFISAAMKVVTDVERIGDHAADIAEIVPHLAGVRKAGDPAVSRSIEMGRKAHKMLQDAMSAFAAEDEAAATAEDMVAYLSGNKGFSIVLYGDDAYTDEELKKYGLPKELTKQEVLDIAIMRYELSTNSFQKYMAVTIATNVSESTVAAVMENQNELQGIDVLEDSVRQYVDDESMGPLLGLSLIHI